MNASPMGLHETEAHGSGLSLSKDQWILRQCEIPLRLLGLHALFSLIMMTILFMAFSFTLSVTHGTNGNTPGNPIFCFLKYFPSISLEIDVSQVSYLEIPAVTPDSGTLLI